MSNSLYLIPTPIGGGRPEEELVPAALARTRALRRFVVENEKSAWRFLSSVMDREALPAVALRVLDEHTEPADLDGIMGDTLGAGDAGVISEAGCPCVADPGSLAVAWAHARGHRVVPLPGPSSILLALMASGFNGQGFAFNGYLPRDGAERVRRLRELEALAKRTGQTQLFMDTPYRNAALIADMKRALRPDTPVSIAFALREPGEKVLSLRVSALKPEQLDFGKVPAIFSIWR